MRTYIAVTTLITMLAASAAFAENWAAAPTGAGKIAAYGYPADNQIQATGAAQYPIYQMLSAMQTSVSPSAGVVLIAGRGGGPMPGGTGSMHRGGGAMPGGMSPMHRGGSAMPGGMSPMHRGGSAMPGGMSPMHRGGGTGHGGMGPMLGPRGYYGHPNWRHSYGYPYHGYRGDMGYYPYGGYGYSPYNYYYPYGYNYGYVNPWHVYPYFYFSW